MEEVAKETNIAFTIGFKTIPMGESFMTMSMHWIPCDWHLKTCILGAISFPKDHTAVNISEKLMDLRLEFGVYLRSFDDKIHQCPEPMRLDKLRYFRLEPRLNKLVLTSDCGSGVLAGAKKNELWD